MVKCVDGHVEFGQGTIEQFSAEVSSVIRGYMVLLTENLPPEHVHDLMMELLNDLEADLEELYETGQLSGISRARGELQ